MGTHSTRYPVEVRDRAVHLVFDRQGEHVSQWEAISSIAGKIGCTAETLRRWVRQAARDRGTRGGTTTQERSGSGPWSARFISFIRLTAPLTDPFSMLALGVLSDKPDHSLHVIEHQLRERIRTRSGHQGCRKDAGRARGSYRPR
jgi:hypothetical protein